MQEGKQTKNFDEIAKEALEDLFEQFWIIREQEPDKYQRIRSNEHLLRNYLLDKFGYRLILHRHFAKLEKIPVYPESWMGIQSFQHSRDYALFCCLLAFLEGKNVDEQFLLTELTEELYSMYPGETGVDWTHYEHRKSLVRVIEFAKETSIIKVVDGDIGGFSFAEEHEVLFEVLLISRYFMRSYPKDLFQYQTQEEILAAEWSEEKQMASQRRQRVYRQLFLSPVMYSTGPDDTDFQYLRQYRHRIKDDIERHTDYQFELYKNAAMLIVNEKKARLQLYPDNKAIMDIALQFAGIVREKQEGENIPLQYDGTMWLTWVDFEKWLQHCKDKYGHGWSKQYREASIAEMAKQLYQVLEEWKMISTDQETKILSLHSALVRVIGDYPRDYAQKIEQEEDR